MPKIPTYEAQKLIPASSGLVRVDVAEAGSPGRALMQEGQALQRVGQEFGELAVAELRRQKEQDAVDVSRAVSSYQDLIRVRQYGDGKDWHGTMSLEGSDARGLYGDSLKWHDDNLSEASKALANDSQRQMFLIHTRAIRDSALDADSRHEAAEHLKDRELAFQNLLSTSERTAVNTSSDEIASERLIASVSSQIRDMFPGRDVTAKVNEVETRLRLAVAQDLVYRYPERAKPYLDKHQAVLGNHYHVLLKALDGELRKVRQERAYQDITTMVTGADGTVDARKAELIALNPETAKKYNLTLDDQKGVAAGFSILYQAQESKKKDDQAKTMESIYHVAATDLRKAMAMARTLPEGTADAKEVQSFLRAAESHQRSLSLMSAQEKEIRQRMEDQGKTGVLVGIATHSFKTEAEVRQAVLSLGIRDTAGFMEQATAKYRDEQKRYGEVNYLKMAQDDWTVASKRQGKVVKELHDKTAEITKTLHNFMQKNNIPVNDPRVYEEYQKIKKTLTSNVVSRAIDSVVQGWDTLWSGDKSTKAAPAPAARSTFTATNPKTGEKIYYNEKEKKWLPAPAQ